MDIFSLGCVLAEMFFEGKYLLFDLAQKLDYRKNEKGSEIIKNIDDKLSKIEDEAIRELIKDMIQKDSSQRKSAREYLDVWGNKIFPKCFSNFFFEFFEEIVSNPMLSGGDERVAFLYLHLSIFWAVCLRQPLPIFSQPLPILVFERIRETKIPSYERFADIEEGVFEDFNSADDYQMYLYIYIYIYSNEEREAVIIILHFLNTCIETCIYPSSKLAVIEIYKNIGKEVIEISKLYIGQFRSKITSYSALFNCFIRGCCKSSQSYIIASCY